MLLCSIFQTSYSTLPAKTYPCIPVPVRQAAWAAVSTHFGCTVETRHRAFLETLDFAEKIKDADLIITGEGKSDRQTLMGKVPSGILQEARRQHIPVILLAGAIEDAGILNAAGFRGVFSITPSPVSLEQAMQPKFAQENIRRTVEQICRIFF